jgi:predicted nucleic acid-binding protein
MRAYPDTSFLCALYRQQTNSGKAAVFFQAMAGPLEITPLLLYEFRQAVRFQSRLHRHDHTKGYPAHQAGKMLADLQSDLAAGALTLITAPWPLVHDTAERLSALHTEMHGYRSMDILHVATALELGATDFLTFDANQRQLAIGEGLNVPL